ncbi:hypothetical protein DVH05_012645 [Phytophthora capsici]|nr:hypothetical protein DVH05_012645 [Phytophthora capsici]
MVKQSFAHHLKTHLDKAGVQYSIKRRNKYMYALHDGRILKSPAMTRRSLSLQLQVYEDGLRKINKPIAENSHALVKIQASQDKLLAKANTMMVVSSAAQASTHSAAPSWEVQEIMIQFDVLKRLVLEQAARVIKEVGPQKSPAAPVLAD